MANAFTIIAIPRTAQLSAPPIVRNPKRSVSRPGRRREGAAYPFAFPPFLTDLAGAWRSQASAMAWARASRA
ncbi:hypothetical protein GCM10010983_32150 [Caulobacter rhizosphaerae]|nr:hypothetical protein GCM10010983_32150 [Caulobacter rhizosphaerae]